MHLANYLGLIHRSETNLGEAFREVGKGHSADPDVYQICIILAGQCDNHVERLTPFLERYGENAPDEPDRLHSDLFQGTRSGGLGLLRDLHDLYLMANEADVSWTMIGQAAQGVGDAELLEVVNSCEGDTGRQISWLNTRMKHAAPQALIAAS